jgi:hypothetical protein
MILESLKRLMPGREKAVRAGELAERHYPGCRAHDREAAAVFRAIERISRQDEARIMPEETVAGLFGEPGLLNSRPAFMDPIEAAELLLALEAGLERQLSDEEATRVLWATALFESLLGPAAKKSLWAPETIWVRSIRGIINERVRCLGENGRCTCGERRPTIGADEACASDGASQLNPGVSRTDARS